MSILLIHRAKRPHRQLSRLLNPALHEAPDPGHSGDAYLLESGTYHLLLEDGSGVYLDESVVGDITGAAAITETPDAASAPDVTVAVLGAAAKTEAADTLASTGQVALAGAAAITEAADTLSSSGQVALAAAATLTEAADTLAATGAVDVAGQATLTEAADTLTAAGTAAIAAAASLTEAADALSSAGQVAVAGAAGITEVPDTVVGIVSALGDAAITEVADTVAADGAVEVSGQASITEAQEAVAAAAQVALAAVAAIQEATETVAAAGTVALAAQASITEFADTIASTAQVAIAAVAAIQEAADTLAATGTVAGTGEITGAGAITEEADILEEPPPSEDPDTLAGAGGVAVAGVAGITEAPITVAGAGTVSGVFAPVQSRLFTVTGVNNTTGAFLSNLTAGNLITVDIVTSSIDGDIATPTDTRGHTYQPATAQQNIESGFRTFTRFRRYFVPNCTAGSCTVTVDNLGTGNGEISLVIAEWPWPGTTPLDDTSNPAFGNSTTPSSGDITPTVGNCLLIGGLTHNGQNTTITEEAGWTLLQESEGGTTTAPIAVAWKLQTTATTEDADWTLASARIWLANVAAFHPVTGAIFGAATITEAASTVVSAGQVALAGQAAIVEANATLTSAGQVALAAAGSIIEAAATLAATAQAAIAGTAGITESAETVVGISVGGILGVGAPVEAADTAAGAGAVGISGAAGIVGAPDTVVGTGAAPSPTITGAAAITEAPSTISGVGAVAVAGVAGITEGAAILTAEGTGPTAFAAAHGSFVLNTGNGAQIVPHAGAFTGKLVLLWSVGASGDAAGVIFMHGAATAVAQWAIDGAMEDGAATTNAAAGGDDTKCIKFMDADTITTEAASFTSFGSGQFTINVTTAGVARTIEYVVLGGTDVDAEVGHYSPGTPAGNLVVSGATFTRKALMLFGGAFAEGTGAISGTIGALCIGMATASNAQWCMGSRSKQNEAAGLTSSVNDSTKCFSAISTTVNVIRAAESFVSFGANSFTVNRTTGDFGEVYYVCLGGAAQYAVKSMVQPSSAGPSAALGMTFQPEVSIIVGGGKADSAVPSSHWRHSFGLALSTSDRSCVSSTDTNAAAPSENATTRATNRIIKVVSGGTPGTVVEADFLSHDPDGPRVQWLTTDSTPRSFGVLSIGAAVDAPVGDVAVAQGSLGTVFCGR